MKNRILALCLALLTIFPLFASCGKKAGATATVNADYRLVYASDADPYTAAAVSHLRSAFAAAGIKLTRMTDDHDAEGKEIRVGVTNRETAPEAEAGKLLVRVSDGNVSFFAADSETLYFNILEAVDLWLSDENATATAGEVRIDETITEKLNTVTRRNDTFRILSQNLRCGEDGNGNDIDDRAPRFRKLVNEYKPDLIGTQESTAKWQNYMERNFSATYTMVGCSRDGVNAQSGEWNTVLVKTERFDILDSGTFWLTETPDVPSMTEGAICRRICTWVTLRDKITDVTFLYCNTHLDHSNDTVRGEQAKLLVDFIEKKRGDRPVYVTGDFNALPESEPCRVMTAHLAVSKREAAVNLSNGVNYTYQNYGKNQSEIDFCFFDSTRATALSYEVISKSYGGYVSDHYGVLSTFANHQ